MPRVSAADAGRLWEQEVRRFFERLGFDVSGGPGFTPGNKGDIDVVAGRDNVLLIGECKLKEELGTRSLSAEIRKFRKKAMRAIRAFKNGYNGGRFQRFSFFKLFFAVKGLELGLSDREALTETLDAPADTFERRCLPSLLFNEKVFEYYEILSDRVSANVARYHLMADMGAFQIRSEGGREIDLSALKTELKGFTLFNFVISPQKLIPLVSVARREADRFDYVESYQRMIDEKRLVDIAAYLNETDDIFTSGKVIPGNIIIATNQDSPHKPTFVGDSLGTLKIPNEYGMFWIVDGQHRLFAYEKKNASDEDKIFVTLLNNFNQTQQRELFVDINDKQKGIDLSYILDIAGDAEPASKIGIIANTIKQLDKISMVDNKRNFFANKIKIPSHGLKKRKFSMKGLYQAIKRFKLAEVETISSFSNIHNPLYDENKLEIPQKLAKALILYLDLALDELGTKLDTRNPPAVFSLTTLLNQHGKDGVLDILFGLFERMLAVKSKVTGRPTMPTRDEMSRWLAPIAEKLYSIHDERDMLDLIRTAGHGPRDDTIRRFCSIIRDSGINEFSYFDDLDIGFNSIVKRTEMLEIALRELINDVLSKSNPDWCKDRNDLIPESIFNALKSKRQNDFQRNPNLVQEGKLYKALDLGLSKDLILHDWESSFANVFVVGSGPFIDKREFEATLELLIKVRNTKIHGMANETERKGLKEDTQKRAAESYLDMFEKALEKRGMSISDYENEVLL